MQWFQRDFSSPLRSVPRYCPPAAVSTGAATTTAAARASARITAAARRGRPRRPARGAVARWGVAHITAAGLHTPALLNRAGLSRLHDDRGRHVAPVAAVAAIPAVVVA